MVNERSPSCLLDVPGTLALSLLVPRVACAANKDLFAPLNSLSHAPTFGQQATTIAMVAKSVCNSRAERLFIRCRFGVAALDDTGRHQGQIGKTDVHVGPLHVCKVPRPSLIPSSLLASLAIVLCLQY